MSFKFMIQCGEREKEVVITDIMYKTRSIKIIISEILIEECWRKLSGDLNTRIPIILSGVFRQEDQGDDSHKMSRSLPFLFPGVCVCVINISHTEVLFQPFACTCVVCP